jgi:photosystem II protein PsbQ
MGHCSKIFMPIYLMINPSAIMKNYRSILSVFFALVTVFLVSCSSPVAVVPPAFNPTQVEQMQRYAGVLQVLRDRFPVLENAIATKNWVDVGTIIHGPLGELRQKTGYAIRNILPKSEVATANEIADKIFVSLEAIDKAAEVNNLPAAKKNYQAAVKSLDDFLQLLAN